jgi:dihydroneopterin aldolase
VDSSSSTAEDRIYVDQLELHARVGVSEDERSQPQRITLNLTAWPKAGFTGLGDDIGRTVNYSELCRSARELVESCSTSLIETLASKVATHLLNQFPLGAVEVELRKYVLPDVKHVAVFTRREAGQTSNA